MSYMRPLGYHNAYWDFFGASLSPSEHGVRGTMRLSNRKEGRRTATIPLLDRDSENEKAVSLGKI